jgi:hypothetical protein
MAALFSVQSDLGTVADANAYIPVAYFRQYWLDRGVDYTASPVKTDAQIQSAIVLATDYVDTRFAFNGEQLTGLTQTTQFPRDNLFAPGFCPSPTGFYPYMDELTGWYYWSPVEAPKITGIPVALKKAICEYAKRAFTASLLVDAPPPVGGRAIRRKRVKVDVIETETEFEPGAGMGVAVIGSYPAADLLLSRAGLIESGSRLASR